MEMRKNRKNFEILVENLLLGYELFHLNKNLHKGIKSAYYHKFKGVWGNVLVSMEVRYWLELATIFDKESYIRHGRTYKNISIHRFLDSRSFKQKFKGYIRIIEKVKKLRNKAIGHKDQETTRNFSKFLRKLGLKENDDLLLFEKTIDVLSEFSDNHGLIENLKSRFEKSRLRIESEANLFT